MSVEELVLQLPRIEKIRLMESLWMALNQQGEEIDSPQWHEVVLRQTEQRVASGGEEAVEWAEAKRRIGKS